MIKNILKYGIAAGTGIVIGTILTEKEEKTVVKQDYDGDVWQGKTRTVEWEQEFCELMLDRIEYWINNVEETTAAGHMVSGNDTSDVDKKHPFWEYDLSDLRTQLLHRDTETENVEIELSDRQRLLLLEFMLSYPPLKTYD